MAFFGTRRREARLILARSFAENRQNKERTCVKLEDRFTVTETMEAGGDGSKNLLAQRTATPPSDLAEAPAAPQAQ